MKSTYEPTISEGIFPEDAGWTSDGDETVLLLSVPELSSLIGRDVQHYSYAWLFDKQLDAYILCFQLNSQDEYAIIFKADHAGRLLLEKEAYESFTIAITSVPFEDLKETSSYFMLKNIHITRQPIASW
jgi:hypothetical protein